MRRALFAIVFLAIVGAALFGAGHMALFAFTPASSNAPSVVLEIQKGQSQLEISKQLASNGVVSDASDFQRLGRWTRQWRKLKAGEYRLSGAMTPMEVFKVISSGISVAHPVTVREGENMYEIASDMEVQQLALRSRVLELCRDPRFISSLWQSVWGAQKSPSPPPSLEGYLFPDTYHFNRTMSAEDMLRQMVRKFASVWTPELEARARALNLNLHQAVTLASMIEKETGATSERPLISSVFHNRLRKRMRLQSDPTTIYGIWEHYRGNLHKSDLLRPTPWNTYTVPALPVGPIGNPGKLAIEAALAPAQSEYLFFVSQNDGTHVFTSTFKDHQAAVTRFQLDPQAREGKSWRDQYKKEHAVAPAGSRR
jgi:UPF0755 protein